MSSNEQKPKTINKRLICINPINLKLKSFGTNHVLNRIIHVNNKTSKKDHHHQAKLFTLTLNLTHDYSDDVDKPMFSSNPKYVDMLVFDDVSDDDTKSSIWFNIYSLFGVIFEKEVKVETSSQSSCHCKPKMYKTVLLDTEFKSLMDGFITPERIVKYNFQGNYLSAGKMDKSYFYVNYCDIMLLLDEFIDFIDEYVRDDFKRSREIFNACYDFIKQYVESHIEKSIRYAASEKLNNILYVFKYHSATMMTYSDDPSSIVNSVLMKELEEYHEKYTKKIRLDRGIVNNLKKLLEMVEEKPLDEYVRCNGLVFDDESESKKQRIE